MTYQDFLRTKEISKSFDGFDVEERNEMLFQWQCDVVKWALKKGRAAIFADCGLGKTPMQLQWANVVSQKSNMPVLICAPLAVAAQTKREGEKFNVPVTICRNRGDVKPGVNITNYEMLEHFDTSVFSGVVLDESSILKAYTGIMKRQIINSFYNTPYRLSCTATPAPNDLMELLNQAEFLGVMKSNEALACWFVADQSNSGHYRLKGHAANDFWKWVSSWAVCMESPSDIGYSNEGYILPRLIEHTVVVNRDVEVDPMKAITEHIDMNATGFRREKRLTITSRTEKCRDIAMSTQDQVLVWCYQNDEADILKNIIPDAVEIRGSNKPEVKERAALDFADGNIRVLISKPSIFGYGLNFQSCHNMVFCGLDYSFESYYQAVRRVYRFGQKNNVNVYKVIGENEKVILDTINRKEQIKSDMNLSMARAMKDFQTSAIHGRCFTLNLDRHLAIFPEWLRSETA